MTRCEIVGCADRAVGTQNGIAVCTRCLRDFVSVGIGAVRFGGRWHGVRGAMYTAADALAFPGLIVRAEEQS